MKKSSSETIFYSVVAIVALLFIAIYSFSPLEADDYWFLEGTQGMSQGWEMFLTACKTMKERWMTDTGRLGNIMSIPFLALLPKWVFNVISGIAVFLMVTFSCRLASAPSGSMRSYLLLTALVLCYPWYDYLFCITFGINYVWAMALTLMASYYLLRSHDTNESIVLTSFLCFVAGWMHEGFGVPISCGGIAVAFLRYIRHTLRSGYVIKLCALVTGSLMTCLSPVFWYRAENDVSNIYKFPLKEMIMQIGPCTAIFIAFIGLLAIVLINRKWRESLSKASNGIEKTLFFTIVLIVSLAVMIKYYNGPRTGAGIVMFASIGIIWFSRFIGIRLSGTVKKVSGIILTTAVTINLGYAVYVQKKLLKEYHEIVRLFAASPSGVIYYDLSYPKADLSMFKTTVRQFHEHIPKRELAWYLDKDKLMVILPTALEGLDISSVSKASRDGFFIYRGYIVMDPAIDLDSPQISVSVPGDNKVHTRFRSDAFHDDAGKEWIFIMPHIQTLDEDLRILDVVSD